ncbi:MAG: UDP-N-acetylglucosamine 2-epimerase (non-hydrolyzing) [Planctomycetes bacterium]|nr:UDP-N-acetylglucosamine 2-epimerase (non-hydrolyzing) [Planctomycetota bacterium]
MKTIAIVFGTRPEAIKLCPLVLALKTRPNLRVHVCVTAQHRQMLDQVLRVFDVAPDADLALMRPDQTLASLTARAVESIDAHLASLRPDLVLVQGDTTSAFCAALAAFYQRIPIGHVEAGLRTWDKFAPFPEEINRALISRVADAHFASTPWARDNLLRESVPAERIAVTGNTVIDALLIAIQKVRAGRPEIPGVPADLIAGDRRLILITGHRRENFGAGFRAICDAIARLARRHQDAVFVYPVHLNPNVRRPVFDLLGGLANVILIDPLEYLPFVALMERAVLILTDSGGIQEEAPTLRKPVLVMRETTERPEGIDAGTARLVGADADRIVEGVSMLLEDRAAYDRMTAVANPYGDGKACERIIAACERMLAGSARIDA